MTATQHGTYWKTTPLLDLLPAVSAAKQQDALVLSIFRARGGLLSPSQVWQAGVDGGCHWLLTSVRRSITNLTDAGALHKSPLTRRGMHGRPESLWLCPEVAS